MKYFLDKKSSIGFYAALLVLCIIIIFTFISISQLIKSKNQEETAQSILLSLQKINTDVIEADLAQQGYLNTGDSEYVLPYQKSKSELKDEFTNLQQLLSNESEELPDVVKLEALINKKISLINKDLEFPNSGKTEALQKSLSKKIDNGLTHNIRNEIDRLTLLANARLIRKSKELENNSRNIKYILTFGGTCSVLIILFAAYFLQRDNTELKEIEKTLSTEKDKFSKAFNSSPVGILITTLENDKIIDVNEIFLRKLNLLRDNVIGKTLSELEFTRFFDVNEIKKVIGENSGIHNEEFNFTTADGENRLALVSTDFIDIGNEKCVIATAIDVTEMRDAEKALTESELRYRSLISVLEEGIIFYNKEGQIISANPSAASILGQSEEELLKKGSFDKDWEMIHEDFSKFQVDEFPINISLRHGKACSLTVMGFTNKDNKIIWISVNSRPILNEQGEVSAGVISFRDITIRKESEHEVQQYLKELQNSKIEVEQKASELSKANEMLKVSEEKLIELNASKDKLFSIISHDLRSPFDSILGFSSIIVDEYDELTDPEIRAYSENIYTSSKHLLSLLDNLLQWSRLQSGRLKYSPEKLRLRDEIQSVIKLMSGNAVKKNINLITDAGEDIFVNADDNMLHSILQNLISNAIKFTNPQGIVKIIGRKNLTHAEIEISDNGIGMEEETVKNLFKIDKNTIRYGTSKEKGNGLGLVLCKELIEKNGGAISVFSEKDKGTKFIFNLPLSES